MKELFFKEVTSTNDMAKSLIKVGETDLLIMAEYQSRGRGKQGAEWFGEPKKNLYLSFTISGFSIENMGDFAIISAVGVKRVLERHGFNPTIKKPNDLLINDKKLCGILCEVEYFEKVPYMIVGVGLNVYTETFPENLNATSLKLENKSFKCDIKELGKEISVEIKKVFNEDINKIKSEYNLY